MSERTSRIKIERPMNGLSANSALARWASSWVANSTIPQPFDAPIGVVRISVKATSPAVSCQHCTLRHCNPPVIPLPPISRDIPCFMKPSKSL